MKKMIKGQFRQGDVLIEKIGAVKLEKVMKPKGPVILANGEVTGHMHAVRDTRAVKHFAPIGEEEAGGLAQPMLLVIGQATEVTHQEHSTIELPPGNFRVSRQKEYAPEAIRNVAD